MKRFTTFLLILSSLNPVFCQFETPQWEMPIYFEDAKGAKDTVWVGFDEKAAPGSNFNEGIFDEGKKWIDTNGFVAYLYRSGISPDSAVIRSITNSKVELYLRVKFIHGKLPLSVYWDSKLLINDSLPFEDTFNIRTAKLIIPNLLGAAKLYDDDTLKNCCFSCYYVNFSDTNYMSGQCVISDSIVLSTQDNDFYTVEKGIGRLQIFIVNLNYERPSGEKEISPPHVQIYPNPASNELKFQFKDSNPGNGKAYIVNSFGAIVDKFSISGNSGIFSRDISRLNDGIYSIIIESNDQFITKVFIKMNE